MSNKEDVFLRMSRNKTTLFIVKILFSWLVISLYAFFFVLLTIKDNFTFVDVLIAYLLGSLVYITVTTVFNYNKYKNPQVTIGEKPRDEFWEYFSKCKNCEVIRPKKEMKTKDICYICNIDPETFEFNKSMLESYGNEEVEE